MKTAVASVFLAVGVSPVFLAGISREQPELAEVGAGSWKIDTVDKTGPGRFTSLRVDTDGNVQVVYVIDDGNRFPLKYAIWTARDKRWFTMTVAENAGACSLALDSKQRPCISWTDFGSGIGAKLHYAKWDGERWRTEAIRLNSEVIAYYNSIALDPNNNPAISFYEYQGPRGTDFRIRLRTVIWNGQTWDLRTVDPQPGSGKFNSMASDSKGHLHIAYANVSAMTAGMRYAFWDGTSWRLEILEGLAQANGDSVGYSAALALDDEGDPHVTYMNETSPSVRYAVRKGGKWRIQPVDAVSGVGYPDRNSIDLDHHRRPYIGYYDAGRGVLKVAHQEGPRWITEIVDGNQSGFTSSMEIAGETIWISYTDERGALKVAHRELAVSEPAGTAAAEPGQQTR